MAEVYEERPRLPAGKAGSPDPSGDELIGKTLGGCRILDKLGEGGMGAVYRARHLALNKHVAIKILPASFSQDENRVKRFVREARSAAQLEHSNIVQILNVAKQSGFYFIVMQYVKGESLDKKIRRAGKLSADEATRIIKETAQALAAAHEKDIIHRDVKPGNIMLSVSGEVKLMDFGLARIRDMVSTLTLPGDILGTPYYLAPEQAKGEVVDNRADIYSLGITYYYALTGKRPFDGDTPMTVILKHINEPAPDPRQFTPDIPLKVFQILMKMMQKDVKARYQSMPELIRDLSELLGVTPSGLTPQTVTYSSKDEEKKSGRPRRRLIILGGLVALVLILLGLASLGKKDRARDGKPKVVSYTKSSAVSTLNIPPDEEAFDRVLGYYSEHPKKYLKNIKVFEKFVHQYPDSERIPKAKQVIVSLRKELANSLRLRFHKFYHHLWAGEYKELVKYLVSDVTLAVRDKMIDVCRRSIEVMKLDRSKLEGITIESIEPVPFVHDQLKGTIKVIYKYTEPNKPTVYRSSQHIWIYKDGNWYFKPKRPLIDKKRHLKRRRR